MYRTRATLILAVCAATAVVASAPGVLTGGGDALKMRAATESQAVIYQTPIDDTVDMDAKIAGAQHRANVKRWNAQVWANAVAENERIAAEAAAAEAARKAAADKAAAAERARATAPAPARSAPVTETYSRRSGNCGGWENLIAAYFPNEVGKACSVMMCESGGSPTIHNRSSSASGLWQFLDSTWRSVTGTPGPAANYSPETQTAAAAKLRNSSGWGQWSCA